MAGYYDKYKNRKGGKYGVDGLQEMVDTHFRQLATKFKLYGFTEANLKELEQMVSIYKPFMKGEI